MVTERNKRYAREQFVRDMDKWYWNRAQTLIKEKIKKTAILAITSMTVSVITIVIYFFRLLHKCRK